MKIRDLTDKTVIYIITHKTATVFIMLIISSITSLIITAFDKK